MIITEERIEEIEERTKENDDILHVDSNGRACSSSAVLLLSLGQTSDNIFELIKALRAEQERNKVLAEALATIKKEGEE